MNGKFLRKILAVVCAWGLSGLVAGAASDPPKTKTRQDAAAGEAGLSRLVAANAGFGIELYGQLRSNRLNVVFSPCGLSSALAMTSAGARGQTAAQMEQALRVPAGFTNGLSAFGRLQSAVLALRQTNRVDLDLASSLWPVKHYLLRPSFLGLLETNFHAPVSPLDYLQNSERARLTLNAWVAEHTQGRVTNLVASGSLGRNTRLVLVSTVEFKGRWASAFPSSATAAGAFRLNARTNITTPLMHQTGRFGFLENRQVQLLSLPYAGEQVELLVLLPRKLEGLESLERRLTPGKLAGWIADLRPSAVAVTLPAFKFSTSYLLNTNLMAMGMKDAFDADRANFAGIDGATHWLYLNQVRQEASVMVDEGATDAAAAGSSEVGGRLEKTKPAQFTADHPFLFLIRERSAGAVLFLGRVMNPAS